MRKFWPGPPVAVGEITRTGREGQSPTRVCAWAGARPAAAAAATLAMNCRRVAMKTSLLTYSFVTLFLRLESMLDVVQQVQVLS
jgi:hypothetical protein